jgi:hypothetical protein
MGSDRPEQLGRMIALVLRLGTLGAVVGLAAGFGLGLLDGGEGPGPTPLVTAIRSGGPDALMAAGLLILTLTPPAALAAAGIVLHRAGERRRAIVAGAVVVLLAASLGVAALIGQSI